MLPFWFWFDKHNTRAVCETQTRQLRQCNEEKKRLIGTTTMTMTNTNTRPCDDVILSTALESLTIIVVWILNSFFIFFLFYSLLSQLDFASSPTSQIPLSYRHDPSLLFLVRLPLHFHLQCLYDE